ncbi:MAG: hypothetical protein R6U64_04470 [Bacteroidales bacterium]
MFFLLILSGCRQKPQWQADVSDISRPQLTVSRYEQVLFTLNPYTLRQDIEPFIEKYYFFLGEAIDTPEGQQQLFEYVTDPFLRELYLDVQAQWPDTRSLEDALSEAFRYYRFHFPQENIPEIFTYVSGIDYDMPVLFANDHLVIGLDNYLGEDYENYERIGVPQYMKHRLTPAHAPVDAIRRIAQSHLQQHDSSPETLLDFIIYEGKLLYFLDSMFPLHHDTLKMPYTESQLKWIQNNAGPVWAYYIENDMFYSTDRQMINKHVGPAPFTTAFSEQSAPRTGAWLGWQIVRKYMDRHSQVTLQELLQQQDARKILNESGYRPGR